VLLTMCWSVLGSCSEWVRKVLSLPCPLARRSRIIARIMVSACSLVHRLRNACCHRTPSGHPDRPVDMGTSDIYGSANPCYLQCLWKERMLRTQTLNKWQAHALKPIERLRTMRGVLQASEVAGVCSVLQTVSSFS